MRERTRYAIRAGLRILIVMPAIYLVLTSLLEMLGFNPPSSTSNFVFLWAVFGAIEISNIVVMR
jgi:hypothetical protein